MLLQDGLPPMPAAAPDASAAVGMCPARLDRIRSWMERRVNTEKLYAGSH